MPPAQLHIVLITAFYPPDRIAGAELGTRFIAKALAARGHKVSVLVTRPSVRNRGRCLDEGIYIHWLPFANIACIRFMSELFFGSFAILRLRPDRIHGQCLLPASFLAGFWGRLLGIPSSCYLYGHDVSGVPPIFRNNFSRWAIQLCDRVFAATEWTAGEVIKLPPFREPELRYSGFESANFSPGSRGREHIAGISDNDEVVLFIGRLIKIKGIECLFRAIQGLSAERPALKIVIIGSGEDGPYFKHLATELKIKEFLVWIDYVPNEDLANYYRAADVFVLPSDREPFGVVNLEALACGTPVVTTGVMGIKEVVRDGEEGIFFTPGDDGSLAAAISRLLDDSDERTRLGQNGVKRAAAFAWPPLLEQWVETFEEECQ